jgi:hypothetical protein
MNGPFVSSVGPAGRSTENYRLPADGCLLPATRVSPLALFSAHLESTIASRKRVAGSLTLVAGSFQLTFLSSVLKLSNQIQR